MGAGFIQTSGGGIRVKNGGIVVAGAGDPCCCGGPCTACTSAKSALTVTFSGITSCACNNDPNASFSYTGNPNGVYTVPFLLVSGSPPSCQYLFSFTSSTLTARAYDATCHTLYTTNKFYILVTLGPYPSIDFVCNESGTLLDATAALFRYNQATTSCLQSGPYNDIRSTCITSVSPPSYVVGLGGTATVTF